MLNDLFTLNEEFLTKSLHYLVAILKMLCNVVDLNVFDIFVFLVFKATLLQVCSLVQNVKLMVREARTEAV